MQATAWYLNYTILFIWMIDLICILLMSTMDANYAITPSKNMVKCPKYSNQVFLLLRIQLLFVPKPFFFITIFLFIKNSYKNKEKLYKNK